MIYLPYLLYFICIPFNIICNKRNSADVNKLMFKLRKFYVKKCNYNKFYGRNCETILCVEFIGKSTHTRYFYGSTRKWRRAIKIERGMVELIGWNDQITNKVKKRLTYNIELRRHELQKWILNWERHNRMWCLNI